MLARRKIPSDVAGYFSISSTRKCTSDGSMECGGRIPPAGFSNAKKRSARPREISRKKNTLRFRLFSTAREGFRKTRLWHALYYYCTRVRAVSTKIQRRRISIPAENRATSDSARNNTMLNSIFSQRKSNFTPCARKPC